MMLRILEIVSFHSEGLSSSKAQGEVGENLHLSTCLLDKHLKASLKAAGLSTVNKTNLLLRKKGRLKS